ncbi:hypothetical protein CPC16_008751 [Podila verticillata]|nr:hypothetical protein CPC16_008751 [Podila verticillata]
MEPAKPAIANGGAGKGVDPAVVEENVKALKSRVIKISKLREVFDKKEQELNEAKSSLAAAQQEIESLKTKLQDALTSTSIPGSLEASISLNAIPTATSNEGTRELEQLRKTLAEQKSIALQATSEHEKARRELITARERQKQAEETAQHLGQKIKATEMLNQQLEQTVRNNDDSKIDLANARTDIKKLNSKLQTKHHELSEAKGELIKLRADALEKAALFADQKKALESANGSKLEETNKELQDQIKELQHQLEDAQAEYHLESEMQKEQFKDTQEDLRTSKKAIEQLEKKSAEASLEITRLKEELRLARIPSAVQVAPAALISEPNKSAPNLSAIPVDRIELAIQSLEEMKTQFSMLQWIHGKKTNDAKIKALEEQVKTLTKEKQALVDALVVRTIEMPPRSMPSRKSSITSETVSAPTPSDTIPSAGSATTPMRKRKASTVTTITTTTPNTDTADTLRDDTPHPKRVAIWDEDFEEFGDGLFEASASESVIPTPRSEQGPSNSTSSTATPKAPTSKPKPIPVPAPPAPTPAPPKPAKLAKAKTTRATKVKPVPDTFANIQIRNISLNPYIPEPSDTLNYFSYLMDTSVALDKKLDSKLNTVSSLLPMKLQELFQAVEKKTHSIVEDVANYREKHVLAKDIVKSLQLKGSHPIPMSQSLSACEGNIVQFFVVLDRHLPDMHILSEWFLYSSKVILQRDVPSEKLAGTSILVRIITAVCRIKGERRFLPVLFYDVLRHYQDAKTCLVLCEAVASIWPAIVASYHDEALHGSSIVSPPRRILISAFQAILATFQESVKDENLEYGYKTFVKKCRWPTLENAPFANEVTEELMGLVIAPEFKQSLESDPGLMFNLQKALELLLVQTYDWIDVYNEFLKPHLLKMMMDKDLARFAIPLVANVALGHQATAAKTVASSSAGSPLTAYELICQVLEQILASNAEVEHQCVSARALIVLANRDKTKLQKTTSWYQGLDKDRVPEDVTSVLEELV